MVCALVPYSRTLLNADKPASHSASALRSANTVPTRRSPGQLSRCVPVGEGRTTGCALFEPQQKIELCTGRVLYSTGLAHRVALVGDAPSATEWPRCVLRSKDAVDRVRLFLAAKALSFVP